MQNYKGDKNCVHFFSESCDQVEIREKQGKENFDTKPARVSTAYSCLVCFPFTYKYYIISMQRNETVRIKPFPHRRLRVTLTLSQAITITY